MFIWNVKPAMANVLKKRFLKLTFHDKNIDDILNMTIDDATKFFEDHDQDKIVKKLKPLKDVGLGYVQLGQSSSTLSGGEAQRIKLASFLVKGNTKTKHFSFLMNLLQDYIFMISKNS